MRFDPTNPSKVPLPLPAPRRKRGQVIPPAPKPAVAVAPIAVVPKPIDLNSVVFEPAPESGRAAFEPVIFEPGKNPDMPIKQSENLPAWRRFQNL